jgi:hypothetical protein
MADNMYLFGTISVLAIPASKYIENSGSLTHSGTRNNALAVRIHVTMAARGIIACCHD